MLEGPILLGRLVFAIELARLREHTLNARRRGRAAKELACHLGKNWQAVLFIILSFPPGQHIQVSVFLDRQREVLIKLVFVARPAEPDTSAAGPRPPPSGRARGARKNSTSEARTGVWSCSNCKLLRGRSPRRYRRLSEGHGDHTDWISCYGVNHYPIGGIDGGQSPGTGKKTPGGAGTMYNKRRVER